MNLFKILTQQRIFGIPHNCLYNAVFYSSLPQLSCPIFERSTRRPKDGKRARAEVYIGNEDIRAFKDHVQNYSEFGVNIMYHALSEDDTVSNFIPNCRLGQLSGKIFLHKLI